MPNGSLHYTYILEAQKHLYSLQWEHWLRYEFLTYQWWVLLGMLIIPWLIWWRLVDKTRTAIILAYGFFIMFEVIVMNSLGVGFQCWIYPINLLPVIPVAIPLDCGFFPVLHMFIFQYFPKWKSFIIAESVSSAILAFVLEPIGEWVGVYAVLHWYHPWSFSLYVLKAVVGKLLIDHLISRR